MFSTFWRLLCPVHVGWGISIFYSVTLSEQKEGHFNNPVGKLSSNIVEIQTAEDYIPDGSSLSCDGEFIFAVELQSSNCDPFVCQPVQNSV